MKVICVGGTARGSGKTSVVELLLRALPGWGAAKVSVCRPGHVCPHNADCGACEPPPAGWEVITCPDVLAAPGKDTARFLKAGAPRAAWVRSMPEHLQEALNSTLDTLRSQPGVVIESTTALPLVKGRRVLVMRQPNVGIKQSALRHWHLADVLAVNEGLDATLDEALSPPAHGVVVPVYPALSPDDPLNEPFMKACGV